MKKVFFSFCFIISSIFGFAQYNVGSSTTTTDYLGRQVTTHRNQYGQVTGTSTTSTDYLGRQVTTHQNNRGQSIGTSTTGTNYLGQQQTQQNATKSNTSIWSW